LFANSVCIRFYPCSSVPSVVKKSSWPAVATRLAAAIPRERLHPAVLAWAEKQPVNARWAVALSGGADSVALLLLLWAHWPERRERLLALHFDHRLRGRASTGDARFCGTLCRALGVSLATGRWTDRPALRSAAPVPEAAARAARIGFFTTELRRRRTTALFLGHHRDDVAETMLMRLARGSGTGGLAAPRPVHVQEALGRTHLRPLLTLDKSALAAALDAAGASWREDASNGSAAHLRNRVRADLIPAWRSAAAEPGRDALGGLALSRDLLEEDADALDAWAAKVMRFDVRGDLALAPLRGAPKAVLRRVLHQWLGSVPAKTDLNRVGFNGLLALVASGLEGRQSLGARHFAVVRRGRLRCVAAERRG
jgi:tRNA(Ile)-lysidine synthase